MELDQLGAIGDLIVPVNQTKKKVVNDNGRGRFDDGQTRTNQKPEMRPLGYDIYLYLLVIFTMYFSAKQNLINFKAHVEKCLPHVASEHRTWRDLYRV